MVFSHFVQSVNQPLHQIFNKGSNMSATNYVRRPFMVSATKVTEENITELAVLLGKLGTDEHGQCIILDRRVVPNIKRAYVGWYITEVNDSYRCWAPEYFEQAFIPYSDEWVGWFDRVDAPNNIIQEAPESFDVI